MNRAHSLPGQAGHTRAPRRGRATGASPTGELLQRWRAGDADARERVAIQHRAILLARARAHPLRPHLWSRPKPEDLVHDALARALDSGLLEHFEDRGPGSLRNLLLRVLDRTILDALRAERAEKRSTNARGSGGDESEAGAIGQHVDRREPSPTSVARSSEWIGLCRSLLAEHEWRVWSAVELEGCTPSEVARMLGLGESSARGILFRARSKILHAFLALEE